jgi:hypothetical protein
VSPICETCCSQLAGSIALALIQVKSTRASARFQPSATRRRAHRRLQQRRQQPRSTPASSAAPPAPETRCPAAQQPRQPPRPPASNPSCGPSLVTQPPCKRRCGCCRRRRSLPSASRCVRSSCGERRSIIRLGLNRAADHMHHRNPPPAQAVVPPELRRCSWIGQRLQQRLVERGCRVHFAVRLILMRIRSGPAC